MTNADIPDDAIEAAAEASWEYERPHKRIGRDCQDAACDRTVSDGPLIRVNPKGERGVFMCQEHAAEQGINMAAARVVRGEPDA